MCSASMHTYIHMNTYTYTHTQKQTHYVCTYAGISSENKFRGGGQIESFKNRGGQNLNQIEFSRAANQVHLSTDV